MKILGRPLGIIWKIWFLLNFAITLTLLYPVYLVLLSRESWYRYCFRVMRVWAHYLLLSNGVFWVIEFRTKLPAPPYIICANHTSYLDILFTYIIFPDYFVFMGKEELKKVPVFNLFFKKMNILVDRKSNTGAHRAFRRASEDVDKGHSLALFPEGTISRIAPKMIPFKNGAFKLAIEKNIPIIPVTYMNGWNLLQDTAFLRARSRPGRLRAIIHPPLFPTGSEEKDLLFLKKRTFETIEPPLKKYYEN